MSRPDRLTIRRESPVVRSARVLQLEGMFDVPPAERSALVWDVHLPLSEHDWNVGLIVGPSGCGKSTIAREFFPDAYQADMEWPADRAVVDCFPDAMSIKDVTTLLSSVGFSSPPSWVRPFTVLSNGEQFRATLARALAEKPALCVFDEFTSVVDRTVGRIGSLAVAKTVRRRKQKFVAVTCHDDVTEWLDPDWIYTPADDKFSWRLLRRRPTISLEVSRVHSSAWRLFAHHHYLTGDLHKAARCFCAFIEGKPVAFHSYLPFVGTLGWDKRLAMRGHRSVVLPDYQGCGIGNVLITTGASMWTGLGYRVFRNTGHPAEIASAVRDPAWRLMRAPSRNAKGSFRSKTKVHDMKRATNRLTASFEYVGEKMEATKATSLCYAEV